MVCHACLPTSLLLCYLFILGYAVLVLWGFRVILHMIVYRYRILHGTDYILVCNYFTVVSATRAFILLAGDSVLDGQVEGERF